MVWFLSGHPFCSWFCFVFCMNILSILSRFGLEATMLPCEVRPGPAANKAMLWVQLGEERAKHHLAGRGQGCRVRNCPAGTWGREGRGGATGIGAEMPLQQKLWKKVWWSWYFPTSCGGDHGRGDIHIVAPKGVHAEAASPEESQPVGRTCAFIGEKVWGGGSGREKPLWVDGKPSICHRLHGRGRRIGNKWVKVSLIFFF